ATNNNNQNSGDTIIRTATVVQENTATGMASISNAAVVSIFPNPSNGIINVDFGFAEATGEFRIMDVTGKMVFNTLINETSGIKNIDVSQLKNGIYFYELTSNGQILKNGRIAILK
ncbi:MAG: T9SS type A sorting domain-containing protein, partial [Bacteroidota bacterium]